MEISPSCTPDSMNLFKSFYFVIGIFRSGTFFILGYSCLVYQLIINKSFCKFIECTLYTFPPSPSVSQGNRSYGASSLLLCLPSLETKWRRHPSRRPRAAKLHSQQTYLLDLLQLSLFLYISLLLSVCFSPVSFFLLLVFLSFSITASLCVFTIQNGVYFSVILQGGS